MKPALLLLLSRLGISAAAFASAALVIDYRNAGDPTFCGTESACFKVRTSDLGRDIAEKINDIIPGASLPAVALGVFAGLLALSFFLQSRLWVRLFAAISLAGGGIAGFLIYQQAMLGQFCAYCMVVDVAMLTTAVSSLWLAKRVGTEEQLRSLRASMATRVTLVWGITGSLVTVMPFLWAEFPEVDPLPAELAKHEEPGKLLVISFTDFQCPFCRRLHPTLQELKAREDVKFVRFMVPLDGHPGAVPAALGYLCVPEAKREDMAHALYEAPDTELTYERVAELAVKVSAEPKEQITLCMGNPATREVMLAEKKLFDDLGLSGLPTTFVGPRKVRGASTERIVSASKAMSLGVALPASAMLGAAALLLALAAWQSNRQLRKANAEEAEQAAREIEEADAETEEASEEAKPEASTPKPKNKKRPSRDGKKSDGDKKIDGDKKSPAPEAESPKSAAADAKSEARDDEAQPADTTAETDDDAKSD